MLALVKQCTSRQLQEDKVDLTKHYCIASAASTVRTEGNVLLTIVSDAALQCFETSTEPRPRPRYFAIILIYVTCYMLHVISSYRHHHATSNVIQRNTDFIKAISPDTVKFPGSKYIINIILCQLYGP